MGLTVDSERGWTDGWQTPVGEVPGVTMPVIEGRQRPGMEMPDAKKSNAEISVKAAVGRQEGSGKSTAARASSTGATGLAASADLADAACLADATAPAGVTDPANLTGPADPTTQATSSPPSPPTSLVGSTDSSSPADPARPLDPDSAASGDPSQPGLFPGDTGHLSEPVRRTLVGLVANAYISYERNRDWWLCLVEHRAVIKSALNDLFLELYVDERNEIAYCLSVESDSAKYPKLKREHVFNEIQSLIIVFLRLQYLSQITGGSENAWVDAEEIHEHLGRLFKVGVVDFARAAKTVDTAIEYMRSHNYLESVKGSKGRYRILPAIETAFPIEKIERIVEEYERVSGASAEDITGLPTDAVSATQGGE